MHWWLQPKIALISACIASKNYCRSFILFCFHFSYESKKNDLNKYIHSNNVSNNERLLWWERNRIKLEKTIWVSYFMLTKLELHKSMLVAMYFGIEFHAQFKSLLVSECAPQKKTEWSEQSPESGIFVRNQRRYVCAVCANTWTANAWQGCADRVLVSVQFP